MSEVQCQMLIPRQSAETASQEGVARDLTVGSLFELRCEGEWPSMIKEKLELRFDQAENKQNEKYKLKLLSFEQTESKAVLQLTSYLVGEHHLKAVQLVDPEHSVILGNIDFTVRSVLQPQETKPEPYGPMGPFLLQLPWWYFAFWVAIFVVVCTFLFVHIKRRMERKKLVEEINQIGSSQTPYVQLNHSIRLLMRGFHFLSHPEDRVSVEQGKEFLEQIEKAFRIFIGRTFQVPSLQWPDRVFIREIKKRYPDVYEFHGQELRKIFRELDHAKLHEQQKDRNGNNQIRAQDLIQILGLVRKNADDIFIFLSKKGMKK